MSQQPRLNFTEFDADPSDLDLIITTTQKLDLTISQKTRPVSRMIHPRPGCSGKGILQEFFRSELLSVEITARHLLTAEVELPRISGRNGLQVPVENVGRDITDSAPNGR